MHEKGRFAILFVCYFMSLLHWSVWLWSKLITFCFTFTNIFNHLKKIIHIYYLNFIFFVPILRSIYILLGHSSISIIIFDFKFPIREKRKIINKPITKIGFNSFENIKKTKLFEKIKLKRKLMKIILTSTKKTKSQSR